MTREIVYDPHVMQIASSNLTSQIDAIKTTLSSMLEADRKDEALELFVSLLSQLASDHDKLQHQLRLMLKERFGRKTERIDPAQLRLFLEDLGKAASTEDATRPVVAYVRRKPIERKGSKALIPDSIPREVVRVEPDEADKTCGCGASKVCIGCERSQVLELIPAQFKVIVYERAKYACKACEGEGVVVAPVPAKPIDGGLPGFGLMADVLIKKYVEHLPLHRIREIYKRHGPDIPVSTLADWVAAGAESATPVAQEIRRHMLMSGVVQVDATPLTVLDRGKPGGSKRGHMYAMLGDEEWVVYDYRPTGEGSGPCEFLGLREGWIQADAGGAFDPLFKLGRAKEAGCWSHARRYFVQALDTDKRAAIPVKWIQDLFMIEREAADRTPEDRLTLRLERSKPILDDLRTWIAEAWKTTPPKSPLGKALIYAVNQWKPLDRFLEDGRLAIHNNACERALRKIAVGRANWLFAGSDEGAERAAVIYTVLGTCRLRGVEPFAWLKAVLEKLASGWKQSDIGLLLPQPGLDIAA
jgi:transposase